MILKGFMKDWRVKTVNSPSCSLVLYRTNNLVSCLPWTVQSQSLISSLLEHTVHTNPTDVFTSVSVVRADEHVTVTIIRHQFCDAVLIQREGVMESSYGNEERESDVVLQRGCGGVTGVRSVGFRWMKRSEKEEERGWIIHISVLLRWFCLSFLVPLHMNLVSKSILINELGMQIR